MKAFRKAVDKDLSWLYFDNHSRVQKRQQVKDQFFFVTNVLFFSKTDPSIFTSIAPVLLDRSNETSYVFTALKSTSYFLPQPTVPHRSDSHSEANSSYCHRSDA